MHLNSLLSFICSLVVLSFSLIAPLVQANERVRFSDALTPVAYQIEHDGYTLYVSPIGNMINIMLVPTMYMQPYDSGNITQVPTISKPNLIFRGECAPAGKIHVGLTDIDSVELSSFEVSANIADFPYQTELDLVSEEIAYQCPDMQNITVVTAGDYLDENIKDWQASLKLDNNWQLAVYNPSIISSGPVSVSFRAHQTGGRYQSIEYNIGTDFEGLCQDEVSVSLSVYPSSDNGNSSPSIANYEWASGNVTPRLLQHCPDLKKINYSMNPMPDEYYCLENCDIYASVESRWSFETGQVINYGDPDSGINLDRLQSYAEIIEALQADEPQMLIRRVLFGSFYYRYLSHYSTACQAYIEDPVPFQYVTTTTTTDGFGNEIGSNTEISDNVTYVERAYADKFDQHYSASNAKGISDIFGSVLSGKMPNVSSMAYAVMREDDVIIRHLREGCMSESVQKVYANLYKLAYR